MHSDIDIKFKNIHNLLTYINIITYNIHNDYNTCNMMKIYMKYI